MSLLNRTPWTSKEVGSARSVRHVTKKQEPLSSVSERGEFWPIKVQRNTTSCQCRCSMYSFACPQLAGIGGDRNVSWYCRCSVRTLAGGRVCDAWREPSYPHSCDPLCNFLDRAPVRRPQSITPCRVNYKGPAFCRSFSLGSCLSHPKVRCQSRQCG